MSDPSASSPPTTERYTVIARRYRPQTFEDLVGQEHVARALQQAITTNRVGHAYLFTGARGVGKTSAARILAKALNCVQGPTPTPCNECDICRRVSTGEDVDVLEIDGASNRGIDEIRQLRQNVAVRPSRDRYKIYIIDEVHMLTKEAFNALLKTLEEPPEHVKFIFATTEPHKIPITILSRCQRFDFAGISAGPIQERLAQIAAAEGVTVESEALQILASRAAGSMRDSQSLLEQLLAAGGGKITAVDVNNLLGIAPAERLSGLVRALADHDAPTALAELDAAIASGVEVGLLLDQLVGYIRDVMALAVGCKPDQLLYALPTQAGEVTELGQRLGVATVLAIGQILDQTAARMRVSVHGRTLVEIAIVRICQLGELDELSALVAELRGTPADAPATRPIGAENPRTASGSSASGSWAPPASKKNSERTAASLAQGLANAVSSAIASAPARVVAPVAPQKMHSPAVSDQINVDSKKRDGVAVNELLNESAESSDLDAPESGSMLAQFQRAMKQGTTSRAETQPPRKSQREKLAEVAEQPLVKRAMELFDVGAGQFRYTPPEGDAN
ncbi:MAG TPA: DNA polymerase III subunit gamma/tau [Lacipirellulaceae bacterium]|nr:DNA polymerase III subunit gamma/tau [Lacipirellulaceae bacterium]